MLHIAICDDQPQEPEAYAANPVNYRWKPIDKMRLCETLSLAISRLDLTEEATLTVKTKNGLRLALLSSIVWCEYANRSA